MIVVDASVAVKWILDEPLSDKAEALYDACLESGETIAAPALLPFEIANVLRQRMVRVSMMLEDVDRLMEQFLAFPVTLLAPRGLHQRALAIADAYGLPAAYDAHYLALAERFDCLLWTDDRRLLRLVGSALPFVRAIDDYTGR